MPKVSVLTPIYNTKPEYLKECIDSILNQTFADFEFIILNDSPENVEIENIVNLYHDDRIKYHKNEKNIGISSSRNKLLDLAEGEYVAIFDHDDISCATRLEKEVKFLDENPDVGVVGSQAEFFPIKKITKYPEFNLDIKKAMMSINPTNHTSLMIRRSLLIKNNIRYDEKASPAEDYMLCLHLLRHTMFYTIPEVLVKYRVYEENTSHRQVLKMSNGAMLCRNYARCNYPYLCSQLDVTSKKTKKYIKFLGFIPILKIKKRQDSLKFYLFGFLPFLTLK